MKSLYFICLALSILSLSCKQERIVSQTSDQPLFAIENTGSKIAPYGPYVSEAAVSINVYKELREQEIPFPEPAKTMPDWHNYYKTLNSKSSMLSGPAKEMGYSLLLNDYGLHRMALTSGLKDALKTSLTVLADNRNKGYKLIYTYLVLLKENNEAKFAAQLKEKVMQYGKPSVTPSEGKETLFEQPKAQKQFNDALLAVRDNESYLQKITLLN